MLYHIGDKFLIEGVVVEVIAVNVGKAWVAPLEDEVLPSGEKIMKRVSWKVLNEKGVDKTGKKAQAIVNNESLAV